jgi:hypothetical protein
MIRVDRTAVVPPAVLTAKDSPGQRERQAAAEHYRAGGAVKPYKFKAYK